VEHIWKTAAEILVKGWPLIKLALVMYAAAMGALWTAVRVLAPDSHAFSFLRALGAIFILAVAGNSAHRYLGPAIGGWYVLIALFAYIAVVKISFELPILRSAIAALIYFGTVAIVSHFLFHPLAH
jgi:hypothetical protein